MGTSRKPGTASARADARRNREALVAAASEVFAERGPHAPLDVIARRAGVGNATLYRHFPTRRDLLVAVSVGEVESLCALAGRLGGTGDPGTALVEWLRAYVEHVNTHSGLAAAFDTARRADSALIAAAHGAVEAAGAGLLAAAEQAGAVRQGLHVADLLALAHAAGTTAPPGDRAHTGRLLRVLLEGIVPRAGDPARVPAAADAPGGSTPPTPSP
ncbi:TetR family transcriptional regulator [Streptomyces fumigatiscleroticus]|nr:TetR family transcriptional regulator [Streptomyces fumigatiscleroticus]